MGWTALVENAAQQWMGHVTVPKGEERLDEFLDFLSHAQKSLSLVTGEADPRVYENPRVVGRLNKLLAGGARISVVGNFKSTNRRDAVANLNQENPHLCQFKRDFQGRFCLHWAKARPEAHFGVADERHVFFEEKHDPNKLRAVSYFYDDEALGREWTENFQRLIGLDGVLELEMID